MPSAEKEPGVPSFKRVIRLTPSIGDWTTFKPPKAEAKKIKLGLRGFDRLSEEELETTHLIHYQFAQRFLKKLKADLGVGSELYLIAVEQLTYQEFLKRMVQPVAQFKILIPELPGLVLSLDLPLASSLINRALGTKDTPTPVRPLTDLEESILSGLNTEEFSELPLSFKGAFEIADFQFMGAPLATADPAINLSETFILFSIELALGELVSRFSIGYQYETLKILLERYKSLPEEGPLPLNKLPLPLHDRILVPATAELGSTTLSTEDLSGLQKGDVVTLNIPLDSLIPVLIGDRLQLLGRPGVKHGKSAIRVTRLKRRIVKEREEVPPPPEIPEIKEEIYPEEEKVEEEYPLEEEEETYPFEEEEEFPFPEEEEEK